MNAILRNSLPAAFCAALALLCLWCAGLRVNLTPSLPKGIYVLCPGTPGKGEYAAFCLEGEFADMARERGYLLAGSCPTGLRPLLKRVAALPGDVIPTGLAVRSVDSLGRALPSVPLTDVVTSGMALVLAEHPGSFDSRYFGLVPLDALQRVKPLFLINTQPGELP